MLMDAELRRRDSALDHAVSGDVPILDPQTTERTLQLANRESGIDESAENHVPRRP